MNKKTFHILVVDDDNRIRELVKEYLEKNSFLITTAKNVSDAKKKLEILKFDIIVLDIMMPGESGLSLTNELKKTDSNPEITLIASGSEVEIAIEALNKLKETNINSKVVSMPCQELFDKQPKEYREKVIDKNSKKISIEAGSIFGWEKYVDTEGTALGLKSFGKSAPYKSIYEEFNLTSDSVVMIAKKMLDK